jgi:hypothetical protein
MPPLPQTIDEVIVRLDEIIARSIKEKSRIGYFPALYKRVTIQVKEGIARGEFEDGVRMARLDVTFANRYLVALEQYERGEPCSACWQVAFEATYSWRPLVLQHLFAGMNAHINLDLGVAAAETCPGESIQSLHNDFLKINTILNSLVVKVEGEIGRISKFFRTLLKYTGQADDILTSFGMGAARNLAWHTATRLAPLEAEERDHKISVIDVEMALVGRTLFPGTLFGAGLLILRAMESSNVARNIKILNER